MSKKKGRPTNKSKSIETVLERLSAGEPLQKICLDESLPSRATILRWRREDSDFARRYMEARKDAAVYHMDEAVKLISGNLPTFKDRGDIERGDPAAVQYLKLQVETRIKTAAVLSPEFSAKHSLEMTGKDGMPLLPPSDPVEIARNIAFALAAGMKSAGIVKPAPAKPAALIEHDTRPKTETIQEKEQRAKLADAYAKAGVEPLTEEEARLIEQHQKENQHTRQQWDDNELLSRPSAGERESWGITPRNMPTSYSGRSITGRGRNGH
jgi:hypothetical protein